MNLKKLRQKGKAYYFDHGGKPRKWEALGSDRAEALRKYADIVRVKDDGIKTLGQLAGLYIAKHQDLSVNTLRAYRLYLKILTNKCNLSIAPIMSVDQGHLNQFIDGYPKKHTARNTALFVKTVYAWAVSRGYIPLSPFTGMRLKGMSRRKRYLTDTEFLAIREKLEPKFQIAADLAYILSLRVSEVVKLKFSDFKEGVGSIWQKKGKRFKYQEVSKDVENALERARTLPGSIRGIYLVCNRKGQPYAENTVSRAIKKAMRAAGIEDSRFHDIRAKSGSDDEETAQKRLDHANPQTTKIYLRKPQVITPIRAVNVEPSTKKAS